MAKRLTYLQTSELRSRQNFLINVGELIQIPVNEKTTVGRVYRLLGESLTEGEEYDIVLHEYVREHEEGAKLDDKWFKHLDILPDHGVPMYAIFDLREK